jgi:hypothetical protein
LKGETATRCSAAWWNSSPNGRAERGPADAGDALNIPMKTPFTGWGNSCLVEWP